MYENVVVLANGTIEKPELIAQRLRELSDCYVIAADGGIHLAGVLSLQLDMIIGDLDSSSEESLNEYGRPGIIVEQHPADKDETDLELALLRAVNLASERVVVLGSIGGRLDMTAANIQVLAHPALVEKRVEIWQENQTGWLMHPPGGSIPGEPGDTLSLLPMGGKVTGLVSSGLTFPLQNDTLLVGVTRGVSNVFDQERAEVGLNSGTLLVVHTPGRA